MMPCAIVCSFFTIDIKRLSIRDHSYQIISQTFIYLIKSSPKMCTSLFPFDNNKWFRYIFSWLVSKMISQPIGDLVKSIEFKSMQFNGLTIHPNLNLSIHFSEWFIEKYSMKFYNKYRNDHKSCSNLESQNTCKFIKYFKIINTFHTNSNARL